MEDYNNCFQITQFVDAYAYGSQVKIGGGSPKYIYIKNLDGKRFLFSEDGKKQEVNKNWEPIK